MECIIDDLYLFIVEFGFVDVLCWQCCYFSCQSGVDCWFLVMDQLVVLDDFQVLSLLCILWEVFNNIVWYVVVSQVEVCVEQIGDSLYLYIDDNGCGFDFVVIGCDGRCGYGLVNMCQCVVVLGGSVVWEVCVGYGFCVYICIFVVY